MRLITRSAQQPLKLPPQATSVWLCRCGLSSDGIFCDGSHTSTIGESPDRLHQYQGASLKRQAVIVKRQGTAKVIYEEPQEVDVVTFGVDHDLFSEVIRLRQEGGYVDLVDRYDMTAHHFAYRVAGQVIAVLRVNFAIGGVLDCAAYYPDVLVNGHLSRSVGSASRLVKRTASRLGRGVIRHLIMAVWRYGAELGIRCDIVNCTSRLIRYYERLGYRRVVDSAFVHPRRGTDSSVMIHVIHPLWKSSINDYLRCTIMLEPDDQLYDHVCGLINSV